MEKFQQKVCVVGIILTSNLHLPMSVEGWEPVRESAFDNGMVQVQKNLKNRINENLFGAKIEQRLNHKF